jgi:hydroxymethylpyrimidine/phosphomethylpyrimidine kinase
MARLLIVAGSDSGGGAGIQADIKTASHFGVFATTAITALTAQNTEGVFGIHEVPPAFIRQQMELVLSDIGTDAIKTGMLHSKEVIRAVAGVLKEYPHAPVVVDPVMVAKGGAPLLEATAIQSLKAELIPLAALVTPNIPEAEILSSLTIKTVADMEKAAKAIRRLGPQAVLVKGGHLEGDELTDILSTSEGITSFKGKRIPTQNTHGTGCTLASAIASGLAQGIPLIKAIENAREYVAAAIASAPGFGHGHGPLNHSLLKGTGRRQKGA